MTENEFIEDYKPLPFVNPDPKVVAVNQALEQTFDKTACGYLISCGDEVLIRRNDMDDITAKLIDLDMTSGKEAWDTVELENGDTMQVERNEIFPSNIDIIAEYKRMKAELNDGICEVTFTKKNGEERVMSCTLVYDHIPEDKHPKGTRTKTPSQDTIAVFDVVKEDWRSFRVDSVVNFERLTGIGKGSTKKLNLEALLDGQQSE